MLKPHTYARSTLRLLVLAATVLVIACSNHAVMQGAAPEVSFRTLKSAEPKPLHDLGKPLLVSFWSTTCGVCLVEMPHLAEIYEQYHPSGFEMVAVAIASDRPSDVVELSEAGQWPFLVALDFDDSVSKAFGDIRVTPTAFLIDADGNMKKKYVGALDLDKFKRTLDEMIDNS